MRQRDYYKNLYETPSGNLKYISRYQFESNELQELVQLKVSPVYSQVIDLTVAQAFDNPLIIKVPGRACVLYGITNASVYDPVANTGIETIGASAFAFARFNEQSNDTRYGLSLKHNRGYKGDFHTIFLSWPAQSEFHARLVIYKFDAHPWQCGEAAT